MLTQFKFYTSLNSIALHCTSIQSTTHCCTVLQSTPFYFNPLHSTPLHSTLLHSTPLHSTLLYSTPLYSTLLYSTLLHSTLLHCTLLYLGQKCVKQKIYFFKNCYGPPLRNFTFAPDIDSVFSQVFDAYAQFEESMINTKMESSAETEVEEDGNVFASISHFFAERRLSSFVKR